MKREINKISEELKEANWVFKKGISTELIREDRDAFDA
jgi:hypothetical protein